MASLSNTLLMLPRELPSYLQVAYSLRYTDAPNVGNSIAQIRHVAQQTFSLIKELIYYRPSYKDLQTNREKLQKDFAAIRQTIGENQKPLCVYFVSANDHNGAILGKHLYYYHHYKIQNLQKHFAVAPELVSSQDEMKNFMVALKQQYPEREIRFVDVVSHGFKSTLDIHTKGKQPIAPECLQDDLFSDCALDATILLDACSVGLGDRNIADEIARKTPGRKILAPGPSMFFSKPVVQIKENIPSVVSAAHGFAVFNAYTCKAFSYPTKMPTQYPYVKDNSLGTDIYSIMRSPILRNAWLDRFVNEERVDLGIQITSIYRHLSKETQALVRKKICENQGHSTENGDRFGETFLEEHPLHTDIRLAFRSALKELIHEISDFPSVQLGTWLFELRNALQVAQAVFRNMTCRQAIAPLYS